MKRMRLMILVGLSLLIGAAALLPGWSAEAPKAPAAKGPPLLLRKSLKTEPPGRPWTRRRLSAEPTRSFPW